MDQQIRFCTSDDGVRIAYATSGKGPPLVKAANYLTHLEHDWNGPVWRHWLRELSRHHTLVRYDERGSGLSDWQVEEHSIEAWVADLEAVVEATDLELVARGLSNDQIASLLHVTPKTVRNYVSRLYDKLGVERRAEAVVLAREAGMGQRSR